MQEPLGTWRDDFGSILTLWDALGPELLSFLCLMSGLIFLVLDILKYIVDPWTLDLRSLVPLGPWVFEHLDPWTYERIT